MALNPGDLNNVDLKTEILNESSYFIVLFFWPDELHQLKEVTKPWGLFFAVEHYKYEVFCILLFIIYNKHT